jgi:hypothetical protein
MHNLQKYFVNVPVDLYTDGYEPAWETFGRIYEIVASEVPVLTSGGNHETAGGENWLPYYLRYPTPYIGSDSPDPAFWGRELGPVHVITLNSYGGMWVNGLQYTWLENYFQTRVNRARTPWVVAMFHVPFYSSNQVHWKEGELFRPFIEPLLYKYGVDVILNGHVHSYERTFNVFNETLDECAPVYLVIGDGGNYEGEADPWKEYPDLPNKAPIWSAFREASFGIGKLDIHNATHAFFTWNRHACGSDSAATYHQDFSPNCSSPEDNSVNAFDTSDETWFIRPSADKCPNRHFTTSYVPMETSTASSEDSSADKNEFSNLEVLLIVVVCCSSLAVVVLGVILYRAMKSADGKQPLLAEDHYASAKRDNARLV